MRHAAVWLVVGLLFVPGCGTKDRAARPERAASKTRAAPRAVEAKKELRKAAQLERAAEKNLKRAAAKDREAKQADEAVCWRDETDEAIRQLDEAVVLYRTVRSAHSNDPGLAWVDSRIEKLWAKVQRLRDRQLVEIRRRRKLAADLEKAKLLAGRAEEDARAGRYLSAIAREETAIALYRTVRAAYPGEGKLAWIDGRIEHLWERLERFRRLQRKADAQRWRELPTRERLDAPRL